MRLLGYRKRMNAKHKPEGKPPRGAGRPKLSDDEATVVITIRVTESQRETLRQMGGSKWVRRMLDASSRRA